MCSSDLAKRVKPRRLVARAAGHVLDRRVAQPLSPELRADDAPQVDARLSAAADDDVTDGRRRGEALGDNAVLGRDDAAPGVVVTGYGVVDAATHESICMTNGTGALHRTGKGRHCTGRARA